MATAFDYVQLAKLRDGLLFSKPVINRATKPSMLNKKLELVDKQINRFSLMANSLMMKAEASEDDQVTGMVSEFEREIFMSALSSELLGSYDDSFFNIETEVDDMKTNLKSIIGEPDTQQIEQQKLEDFHAMARRIEIKETFTNFIKRLQTAATEITSTDYSKKLVENQFEKSLRQMDKDVLDFHADADKVGMDKINHFAQILDKIKMNAKAEVKTHHLEIAESFEAKFEAMEQRLSNRSDSRFDEVLAMINQMQLRTSSPPAKPDNKQPEKDPKPKSTKKKTFKQPKPSDYCLMCGLRKCKDPNCKGNDDLTCILCNKTGHIATSRHFHGSSKN